METSVCIEQKGTVEEIFNHSIKVKIHRDASCSHCNAQGMCIITDDHERIIETHNTILNLEVGDHVDITITRRMGNMAVILGYLVPFLILLSFLILLNSLGLQELLSGLISMAVLVPYYMFLYLFRDKLRRTFAFSVRKTKL